VAFISLLPSSEDGSAKKILEFLVAADEGGDERTFRDHLLRRAREYIRERA